MTQRTEQVASTLKRAVQEVLSRGIADPRVQGLITVSRVLRFLADLANATVYCTVTPHKHEELIVAWPCGRLLVGSVEKYQTKCGFAGCHNLDLELMRNLLKQQEVLASIAQRQLEKMSVRADREKEEGKLSEKRN